MAPKTILIMGGYGNTGRPLARLLLQVSDAKVVIAGRNREKADRLAQELNELFSGERVQAITADASNPQTLQLAFRGLDLVVVASSTTQYVRQITAAALDAGIDYIDVQFSPQKIKLLRSLEPKILQAGRCFITDGGFHPGLPGFLVRYVSQFFDSLESARVGSVIKEDWKTLQVGDAAISELVELINDFEMQVYKSGRWQKSNMLSSSDYLKMDFGNVFGWQYCFPMMLEEMRSLPELYPTLTDTGFYVGSFNWFVDWVIMPIAVLAVKLWPQVAVKPMGRWMHWGLKAFSKPPYGTLLKVEATGKKAGIRGEMAATISHTDGYLFTAIPVAACLLQYLDGSIKQPGLWWQALVVEPNRFMADMQRMGISVETTAWRQV